MIPCPWSQRRGKPLLLTWCPKSNGFDDSSIRALVVILWHIEAHLLQAFRDTYWIPTWGIEFQLCIKSGFRWVMQACLGRLHVGTLATCSQSRNLQSWPICAKNSHSLTKQNPSFKNWPKTWSLVHGTRVEGHLYHYLDVLNPMQLTVHRFEPQ